LFKDGVTAGPVPLRKHVPEAPAALERVVAEALAREPGERFRSAAAFARALENARGEASLARPRARGVAR
jgi:hypothetical protein